MDWIGAVTMILFVVLAVTGVAVIRTRNLFGAVMLAGIYSLVSAVLFVVMDAVDVAFTEAAVGAGISTVLLLGTLSIVGYKEKKPVHQPILPFFVVLVTGGILVYGTSDIPPFGEALNPAHQHELVSRYYLDRSYDDSHIPNVVTTVLGSYRGYDTMGETVVVFAAMVGVFLLLVKGPLPNRVHYHGRWHRVPPGKTRSELLAELRAKGPKGSDTGVADG